MNDQTFPHAITAAAIFVALAIALGVAPVRAEPRYGVCRQQIAEFVQQRLGHTVTRIEVQSYSQNTPALSLFDPGSALVYVKECEGFHAFEIRGTESLCEHIPHYGHSSGSYVRYEGAYEGCQSG